MTRPGPVHGIVLAAGMSRRLGHPKQLLDVGGKPLIRHVVERCLGSSLDAIWVVVGHEAEAVRQDLANLDIEIVVNPNYASGQASSLIAGLEAASSVADAVVIALGDQPLIAPEAIDRLVAARRMDRALVAMASYGDERGHPVLFGRELFDELRGIEGDQGGREVIRRHPGDVVLIPGGSAHVPLDVDTEDAYVLLLEQYANDSA
ncbi:MAG: nucleotidyltransferase family protein [Chloroflexia bacterium]|nr:nucleotidyltransferase family protein [Chloroflexia bacterium]